MKIILNMFFLILPFFIAIGQVKETIHLSFNLDSECHDLKKVINKNGVIHFYIESQHFTSISKDLTFTEGTIKKLKKNQLINISEFLKLANEERERLIEKGEKNKSVKILFNNNTFDKIYLYVKDEKGLLKRYLVSWVEEIE